MSDPGVDIEVQKKRHKGPLIGMAAAVVFALAAILFWALASGGDSDDTEMPPTAPAAAE
ncbi:hypothetical protein [Tropicimonas sp. IMCC34043]|uniref:hypothetical protein n=1 Tax=Tropicimonas sp. IMCC34043 TaxID=2248760 RepID=UPI0018E4F6FA|nr:hypothetical protein [Tropicimonas sp. IMCC34043]